MKLQNIPHLRFTPLHLLAMAIITTMVLLESRNVLFLITSFVGTGNTSISDLVTYSTITQIRMGVPLILLDLFELPSFLSTPIFLITFRVIAGLSMYFLVYRLLFLVIKIERKNARIAFSTVGSLIYLHYPYNVTGDNFIELVFIRALAPLFILSIIEFYSSKKISILASSISLLALMIFLDPRALLFVGIPALFIIVIPKIITSSFLRGAIAMSLFLSIVAAGFALSSFSVFPRFTTEETIPTTVHVPIVKDAFRYSYASLDNVVRGLSFESTNLEYGKLLSQEPAYASLNNVGLALLLILSVLLVAMSRSSKDLVLSVPSLALVLILVLLFASIDNEPMIVKVVFSDSLKNVRETSGFAEALGVFRTPRIMDMMLGLIYSILVPFSLARLMERLNDVLGYLKFKSRAISQQNPRKRSKLIVIAMSTLSVYLVFSMAWVFIANGSLYANDISRSRDYDNIKQKFQNDVLQAKVLSLPFNEGQWNFPQEPVGLGNSILRYYYAYTLGPEIKTSLLSRGQMDDLAENMQLMGIKYLIIDENDRLGQGLRQKFDLNEHFSLVYQTGKSYVYALNNYSEVLSPKNAVFVLGGYETFRNVSSELRWDGNSVAPIFLDSPVSDKAYSSSFPIVLSPEKTELDLTLSMLINSKQGTIIAPARFATEYNPAKSWSPADVTDSHHSLWTWTFPQNPGYQWEYSYQANYGFVTTSGPDTLSTTFSVDREDDYSIYARVLMKNQGESSLVFSVDNMNVSKSTSWANNKLEFTWVKLGDFHLSLGKHKIDILNEEGSNAVNILLAAQTSLVNEFQNKAHNVLLNNGYVTEGKISQVGTNTQIAIQNPIDGNFTLVLQMDKPTTPKVSLEVNGATYDSESIDDKTFEFKNVMLIKGSQYATVFAIQVNQSGYTNGTSEIFTAFDFAAQFTSPKNYSTELDARNGDLAYKVSSNSTKRAEWSWIQSPPISVTPGSSYKIETNMKWENVKQSHISVDYLTSASSVPKRITAVPNGMDGTSDWQKFERIVTIPKDAQALKITLNAGWTADGSNGKGTTWFGPIALKKVQVLSPKSLLVLGPSGTPANIINEDLSSTTLHNVTVETPYPGYREYHVSLSAQRDIILAVPEIFTGTYKISSNASGLDYVTFPISDVFSGFLIKVNDNTPKILNLKIYNDSKLASAAQSSTTLLLFGLMPALGFAIDRFYQKNKYAQKTLQKIKTRLAI